MVRLVSLNVNPHIPSTDGTLQTSQVVSSEVWDVPLRTILNRQAKSPTRKKHPNSYLPVRLGGV